MRQVSRFWMVLVCLAGPVAAEAEPAIEEALSLIESAEIVIVGEVHDNPVHHQNQAKIVGAISPSALVFEMIAQEKEGIVNDLRMRGAGPDEIAEALSWETSGWPDFGYYWEILEAAPDAKIFGAGQTAADIETAASDGASAAFGRDAPVYGLDIPLPEEAQSRREHQMAVSHCNALPEEALPGMVEVQRFRDASLADAAIWARTTAGADGPVVVITGSGHANKRDGVPSLLSLAAPDVSVVSIGQLETGQDAGEREFDTYLLAPPPDRDDPCLRFKKEPT